MDYVITDGPNQVTGIVTVTVTADQLPVAVDDSATVTNAPPGPDGVPISVLANDTDPDDLLAYSGVVIVQQPLHGFISQSCVHGVCNPPGYSPNPRVHRPRLFHLSGHRSAGCHLECCDSQHHGQCCQFRARRSQRRRRTVTIGQAVGVNVILNDTDPDGDPLTITAVTRARSERWRSLRATRSPTPRRAAASAAIRSLTRLPTARAGHRPQPSPSRSSTSHRTSLRRRPLRAEIARSQTRTVGTRRGRRDGRQRQQRLEWHDHDLSVVGERATGAVRNRTDADPATREWREHSEPGGRRQRQPDKQHRHGDDHRAGADQSPARRQHRGRERQHS